MRGEARVINRQCSGCHLKQAVWREYNRAWPEPSGSHEATKRISPGSYHLLAGFGSVYPSRTFWEVTTTDTAVSHWPLSPPNGTTTLACLFPLTVFRPPQLLRYRDSSSRACRHFPTLASATPWPRPAVPIQRPDSRCDRLQLARCRILFSLRFFRCAA